MNCESDDKGGTGGKDRKLRPIRKHATPYDRPARASTSIFSPRPFCENANENRDAGGGWLSRIVNSPASRLIAGGATRLISAVLPVPTTPVDDEQLDLKVEQGADDFELEPNASNESPQKRASSAQVPSDRIGSGSSDDDWLFDFEQLLKQTTLSRNQFNHISDLLQSKTVDNQEAMCLSEIANTKERSASSLRNNTPQIATPITDRARKLSNSLASSNVHNDSFASLTDISKAHMLDPSIPLPHFQGQTSRKDLALSYKSFATPAVSRLSPSLKSPICWPGAMAQDGESCYTPAKRAKTGSLTAAQSEHPKVSSGETDIRSSHLPSYQWKPPAVLYSGARQVQPISEVNNFRPSETVDRMHKKSTFVRSSIDAQYSCLHGSSPLSSRQFASRNISTDTGKDVQTKSSLVLPTWEGKMDSSSASATSCTQESSAIGSKILEQLDKMLPSPKNKPNKVDVLAGDALSSKISDKSMTAGEVPSSKTRKGTQTQAIHTSHLRTKSFLPDSVNSLSGQEVFTVPESGIVTGTATQLFSGNLNVREAGSSAKESRPLLLSGCGGIGSEKDGHCFGNDLMDRRRRRSAASQVSWKLENSNSDGNFKLDTNVSKFDMPFVQPNHNQKQGNDISHNNPNRADGIGFTFPVFPALGSFHEPPPTPTLSPSLVVPIFTFSSSGITLPAFSFGLSTVPYGMLLPKFEFGINKSPGLRFSYGVKSAVAPQPLHTEHGAGKEKTWIDVNPTSRIFLNVNTHQSGPSMLPNSNAQNAGSSSAGAALSKVQASPFRFGAPSSPYLKPGSSNLQPESSMFEFSSTTFGERKTLGRPSLESSSAGAFFGKYKVDKQQNLSSHGTSFLNPQLHSGFLNSGVASQNIVPGAIHDSNILKSPGLFSGQFTAK